MFSRKLLSRGLFPAVILIATLLTNLAVFRPTLWRVGPFEDDFFYYLKTAINFNKGLGPSFDGQHWTNGYHPLWFLCISAFSYLFGPSHVFLAVLTVICFSSLAVYFMMRYVLTSSMGLNGSWATLLAGFLSISAMYLMSGGMEVVLALPAAILFCTFRLRLSGIWNFRDSLLLGLLASLLILSRLDAALLVIALLTQDLVYFVRRRANLLSIATGLMVGFLPIILYLFLNLEVFHTLMPVSSLAKQLRVHHYPSLLPLRSVLMEGTAYQRLILVLPTILLFPLAAWCFANNGWGKIELGYRHVISSLILFPLLQVGILSIASDWKIFEWYLYSFVLSEIGLLLYMSKQHLPLFSTESHFAQGVALLLVVCMTVSLILARVRNVLRGPDPRRDFIYLGAEGVADFAVAHTGVYAMGDRAGMVGFLLQDPVVQLEGLVMDPPFLRNIREEQDLLKVLGNYHVQYYVTASATKIGECYQVREPAMAGPDSLAMRGILCQPPEKIVNVGGKKTYIFHLR